jgi:hypothetical protein
LYGKVAWLTIIIWCFYPIVWLFSEGFASFSVSFEVRTTFLFYLLVQSEIIGCVSDGGSHNNGCGGKMCVLFHDQCRS